MLVLTLLANQKARERGLKDEADVIIFSGAETRVDHLTRVQIGSQFQFLCQTESCKR